MDDDGGLEAVEQVHAEDHVVGEIGDDGEQSVQAGRAEVDGGVGGAGDGQRAAVGGGDAGEGGREEEEAKTVCPGRLDDRVRRTGIDQGLREDAVDQHSNEKEVVARAGERGIGRGAGKRDDSERGQGGQRGQRGRRDEDGKRGHRGHRGGFGRGCGVGYGYVYGGRGQRGWNGYV